MTDITVTVKNVYGNRLLYPACDVSRKLAELIGTKTFTRRDVDRIIGLGYNFTVQPETI
jgi:chromatin remodeling complex protein RSC6